MGTITILEGRDLQHLLETITDSPREIYRLRFTQTHDGKIKIKANESVWSPALGNQDNV